MVVKKDYKKKADTVNRVYAVQYTYIDCEFGIIKTNDETG